MSAFKARGGSAIVVAHRPAVFAECDLVMLMERGRAVKTEQARSSAGVPVKGRPVKALRTAAPAFRTVGDTQ